MRYHGFGSNGGELGVVTFSENRAVGLAEAPDGWHFAALDGITAFCRWVGATRCQPDPEADKTYTFNVLSSYLKARMGAAVAEAETARTRQQRTPQDATSEALYGIDAWLPDAYRPKYEYEHRPSEGVSALPRAMQQWPQRVDIGRMYSGRLDPGPAHDWRTCHCDNCADDREGCAGIVARDKLHQVLVQRLDRHMQLLRQLGTPWFGATEGDYRSTGL